MPLIAVAIAFLLVNPIAVTSMQDKPAVQAARPQRTEAEARARAEENRRRRAEERRKTGAPVELISEFAAYDPQLNALIGRVFTTHRIEMDVFHGKRIRPVTCGGADRAR